MGMPNWFPAFVGNPDDVEVAADQWEQYVRDMEEINKEEHHD